MKIEYDEEVDAAFVYFNKSMEEARSEAADVELGNAAIIFCGAWTESFAALNSSVRRASCRRILLMANRVQRT